MYAQFVLTLIMFREYKGPLLSELQEESKDDKSVESAKNYIRS